MIYIIEPILKPDAVRVLKKTESGLFILSENGWCDFPVDILLEKNDTNHFTITCDTEETAYSYLKQIGYHRTAKAISFAI